MSIRGYANRFDSALTAPEENYADVEKTMLARAGSVLEPGHREIK
jgi:hypothetical protein